MEVLLAAFSALFSVVNPFGAIPVFLVLTEGLDTRARTQQVLKACLFTIGILVTFFYAGTLILDFFGLKIEYIRMAGGIIIAQNGIQLTMPGSHKGKPLAKEVVEEGVHKTDISFTPLAMPMMAGPGSIAVTIALFKTANQLTDMLYMTAAIVLVAAVCFVVLRAAVPLNKFLGKGGMAALARMMGFIVLSIGIGLIMSGFVPLIQNTALN